MSTLFSKWLETGAVALFAVAVIWWLIVYAQVVLNTGMEPLSTVPCLFYTSDRCSLAMALCKNWHFLGIKRYFAEPLWGAAFFGLLALVVGNRSARTR